MELTTYEPATEGRIELSYSIEVDHHTEIRVGITYLPGGEAIRPDSLDQPLADLYHRIEMDSPRREEAFTDHVYSAVDDAVAPDHLQVTVEPQVEKDINHEDLYHVDSIERTQANDSDLFSED